MDEQDLGSILGGSEDQELPGSQELNADSGAPPLEGADELNKDAGVGRLSGEDELNNPQKAAQKDDKPAAEASTVDKAQPQQAADEDSDDPHPVPRKVLVEERKKRQEEARRRQDIEQKFALLQGKFEMLSQQLTQKPAETKAQELTEEELLDKYLDNPVAFLNEQIKPIKQLLEEKDRTYQQTLQAVEAKNRFYINAALMREKHEDFEEVAQQFADYVEQDPIIKQRFQQHPQPAWYAYNFIKNREETQGMGSIAEWKARKEKEIEERLKTELAAQERQQSVASDAAELINSSASAQNVGVSPVNFAEDSLEAILAE